MGADEVQESADVLIVGAGPVGLTAALALTRNGVSCRIVDRNAARTDKSKALVLWSRTLELLDGLGGVERFLDAGMRAHGASLYGHGKRLVHASLDDVDSPYPFALMIPQSDTERLLEEWVESLGVRIERQVDLRTVAPDAGGVGATLVHPDGSEETVRTPWLIACDGAHSTVRHQLGLDFTGKAEPDDWILADVFVAGPIATDEISLYWHEHGVLAMFPMIGERFRMIADVGPHPELAQPETPTLAQAQALLDERGPGGLVLKDPVWLSGFRINERKLAHYRHGRVLFAGDAAHVHSPAGGQGMNTGVQDVCNLGWKLALVHAGRARDALLDTFDVERSEIGERVLRNAAAMTRVATLRSPLAQSLRNHLVPLIASLEFVQARFKATLTELAVDYPTSALNGEHHGAGAHAWLLGGGVLPGARAVDAPLVDPATGAPTTLFATLDGTTHTLLLLTGPEPDAGRVGHLVGIASALHHRFGELANPLLVLPDAVPGAVVPATMRVRHDPELAAHRRYAATAETLYLIRPDGYVSFRALPADVEHLLAHLDVHFVPADTAR
ncbi:FAD-dependent monooxygenase [Candidatus Binatia bacterium]|nr:FAD-dependent monooxygenase [Candidatus Binatia bacterium]